MGRYTRDELLTQALDLAMSPPLNAHDRPGDVIDQNAYSIKWLQSALDRIHVKFPFSTDIQDVQVVFPSSSTDMTLLSDSTKYLPTDFILDVKDGLTYTSSGRDIRLKRKTFQQWLSIYNDTKNQRAPVPNVYCIIQNKIKVAPIPSTSLSGTLWYYKLPGIIHAAEYPNFPDEWTLIEYVHVKALEWNHSVEVGTGQAFLEREVARLKASGLLNNTEYDQVPLENNQVFVSPGSNRNAWMGDISR